MIITNLFFRILLSQTLLTFLFFHQTHADFGRIKATSYIVALNDLQETPQTLLTPDRWIDPIELPRMGNASLVSGEEENRMRETYQIYVSRLGQLPQDDDLEAQREIFDDLWSLDGALYLNLFITFVMFLIFFVLKAFGGY